MYFLFIIYSKRLLAFEPFNMLSIFIHFLFNLYFLSETSFTMGAFE